MRLLAVLSASQEGHPCRCRLPTPGPGFEVTADAHGICRHAGVVLLGELAGRLGLTAGLGPWGAETQTPPVSCEFASTRDSVL